MTRFEVLYNDGLGAPRRWSLVSSLPAAERSLARLVAFLGARASAVADCRIVRR